MMFSDEEIKEMPENSFMRPGDEIISIREVCLIDKFDKKDLGFNNEPLLLNTSRNDLDVSRSLFRDVFPEGLDPQARFAWTEEDGNIASLVSEPGFGTTGQTSFGKDLDAALHSEMKEADTSSAVHETTNRNGLTFRTKPYEEQQLVSSTSNERSKTSQGPCKVDKTDPRSRYHFVKYVKRHGRTVKLWECGICTREFQHQYTLMRHLPTHTDERNFHCTACGKSFRQLSTLSQHRAIHSTERPYACEVCYKTFNRVSTLISHRKTHSNEKPYRCNFCPKGFHQKGNLRNHLFTHTNERPYRCNICFKGFNQQSNLVCHKNKAHPEDGCPPTTSKDRSNSRSGRSSLEAHPETSRPRRELCEVTSTVGPLMPSIEAPSTSTWPTPWDSTKPHPEPGNTWTENPWSAMGSGVVVDQIKTFHMGVAIATKQTPFALLKPDNSTPVLVKVIDTKLPGGKQMLVPATAEDLKIGGKIVLQNEDTVPQLTTDTMRGSIQPYQGTHVKTEEDIGGAVQIRVPVVAIVVPKIKTGGRLHLAVEEPHHAYHTALSTDVGEVKVEPCTTPSTPRPHDFDDNSIKTSDPVPSCALPPPAPSPPLDFISMDLFDPMECIPMGPQITAVYNYDQPSHSDDSDIFIGEFDEGIPLSDTD